MPLSTYLLARKSGNWLFSLVTGHREATNDTIMPLSPYLLSWKSGNWLFSLVTGHREATNDVKVD